MRLQQDGEGRRIEQRNVAADNHDVARETGRQRSQCLLDRTPGAGRLILVDDDRLGKQVEHDARDDVALVAHDHRDVSGADFARRGEHVPDDRNPRERVKDLGPRGLHPRPLSGGEHDDGEILVGHCLILP